MSNVYISPEIEAYQWDVFRGNPMQAILHDALNDRILKMRQELEVVTPENLVQKQGFIAGLRNALELLHSKDSDEIRKMYERRDERKCGS